MRKGKGTTMTILNELLLAIVLIWALLSGTDPSDWMQRQEDAAATCPPLCYAAHVHETMEAPNPGAWKPRRQS